LRFTGIAGRSIDPFERDVHIWGYDKESLLRCKNLVDRNKVFVMELTYYLEVLPNLGFRNPSDGIYLVLF
jgi:hypothetical protein